MCFNIDLDVTYVSAKAIQYSTYLRLYIPSCISNWRDLRCAEAVRTGARVALVRSGRNLARAASYQ
jgi:hypothetical protein